MPTDGQQIESLQLFRPRSDDPTPVYIKSLILDLVESKEIFTTVSLVDRDMGRYRSVPYSVFSSRVAPS